MYQDRKAIRSKDTPATAPEDAARRSLHYIRETMERSSSFTAVPGWGNVAIGVAGLSAAWIAAQRTSESEWLATWLAAAGICLLIGVAALTRKAMRMGIPVLGGAGRKFFYGLAPAFFSGALLTGVLYEASLVHLLPGVWLLLYGSAIVSAGMYSVPLIRQLGLVLIFLGTAAFFTPEGWGNALLALGFGGGHLVAGGLIVRQYGG